MTLFREDDVLNDLDSLKDGDKVSQSGPANTKVNHSLFTVGY